MKKNWAGMGLLALGLSLFAPDSQAETHEISGTACQGNVLYNQWGAVNNTTLGTASVVCPLIVDNAPFSSIGTVSASVYDRNDGAGKDVACTLIVTNSAGDTLFSQAKATTGASLAVKSLTWGPTVAGSMGVLQCSIPASTAALGASGVTRYAIVMSGG